MISPWAVLLTPACDVDQKAELLRALTIEIFSEPSRAKFREEFFAFCMRIKFRWNQNSCEDVPDMFKRAGSLSRIRSDSVGKWDAQSGFKNWGGSPNGRKLVSRVCGFKGYLWAPLGVVSFPDPLAFESGSVERTPWECPIQLWSRFSRRKYIATPRLGTPLECDTQK